MDVVKARKFNNFCAQCKSYDRLSLCAGCQSVRYCGSVCQKAHWSTHKGFCKRMKASRATETGISSDFQKHLSGFLQLHRDALRSGVACDLNAFRKESIVHKCIVSLTLLHTPKECGKKALRISILEHEVVPRLGPMKELGGPLQIPMLVVMCSPGEVIRRLVVYLFYHQSEIESNLPSQFNVPMSTYAAGINRGSVFLKEPVGGLREVAANEKVPIPIPEGSVDTGE